MSSASINVNESAVRDEAVRIFRQRQEKERREALERQRATERALADQAARERELRLQREAEEIEVRRRAEASLIAAQAKAEKEAHEAAVAAYLEELEGRSPQEKLMAELESLRDQLTDRVVALDTSYTSLRRDYTSYKSATPWSSGLDEIKGMIRALDARFTKETAELRAGLQRPARTVSIYNCPAHFGLPATEQGGNRQLSINYQIMNSSSVVVNSGNATAVEGTVAKIEVPAGNLIRVVAATVTVPGGHPHRPHPNQIPVIDHIRHHFDC
jgi:hypothetical protein